jgi:hypothetical protein
MLVATSRKPEFKHPLPKGAAKEQIYLCDVRHLEHLTGHYIKYIKCSVPNG